MITREQEWRDFAKAVIRGMQPEDYGKEAAFNRRMTAMAEDLLNRSAEPAPVVGGVGETTARHCESTIKESLTVQPTAPASSAPSAFVLVPREPTPEMIQAFHDRHFEGAGYIDKNSIVYALYVECYRAMLSAADKEEGR